jgi:uncharacterized protein (TIGR02246 family)
MSGDIQIRERIEAWAQALRAKDLNALMAHYAPDIVTFDVMPLQSLGADAYRKNFEAWFASVQGPIDYEIRDLRITMRDDVAFSHYVGNVRSTRTTGEKNDYWVRVRRPTCSPIVVSPTSGSCRTGAGG